MNDTNSFRILYDGIFVIQHFSKNAEYLFTRFKNEISWDNRIKSRKTASFGKPYNYSDINYELNSFPNLISEIIKEIVDVVGYEPNNCLINFYYENSSKMGFHSDEIEILEPDTGIIILSLGNSRIIRFKNKQNTEIFDFTLHSGSLLYMTQETQKKWLHSILSGSNDTSERISITFRKIKV